MGPKAERRMQNRGGDLASRQFITSLAAAIGQGQTVQGEGLAGDGWTQHMMTHKGLALRLLIRSLLLPGLELSVMLALSAIVGWSNKALLQPWRPGTRQSQVLSGWRGLAGASGFSTARESLERRAASK
ncbi:hypothetical protein Trco_007970 [Trichoderma cornu-damae]|uniref:Uncharacterized protein n=1 Tax=Trichoderma cornu-damae TaxID=654480 RepID=A0A9P8QI04_9HYPO|nr:hypothetical protein Trco_007970 [Trichoderma cornu-damae]